MQTAEDKEAPKEFSEIMIAEPDREKNLAVFEDVWQKNICIVWQLQLKPCCD